jgi:AI-2 transport protein TqsA
VSLRQLAMQFPVYREQLDGLIASLNQLLARHNIDAIDYLQRAASGPEVGRWVLNASGSMAASLSNLVLTLFIFAFMLGGMWELERRASKRSHEYSPLAARFLAFSDTIRGYMGVRAVLGLVAAVLDYLLLVALGVDYALLWGVLSFVLSFVPNVGFTLSLIPPTLLALVGGGWQEALIVFVGYQVINNVLDNVIGPRFIGREMKISALLSFLSVIFWAWVLGPTGAILAVPLTVLVRDLAFGPADPPDLGPPQPVTSSTVPTPQSDVAHPREPEAGTEAGTEAEAQGDAAEGRSG